MNLLDDSLPSDLMAAGRIDEMLTMRFGALVEYAQQSKADGVLFTCSAFGEAIEVARRTAVIPVLKPNEAMFQEALRLCSALGRKGRIGMVSTFAASVPSMQGELEAMARDLGIEFSLQVECPEGALQALGKGRVQDHDALVSEAAQRLQGCDVIMLGQFSTATMRGRVALETSLPVLSSPDSAVNMLKTMLYNHRS